METTKQQVMQAQLVMPQFQDSVITLNRYIVNLKSLLDDNGVLTLTIGGVTVSSPISPADQQLLLDQYTVLKANIVILFSQLP